MPTISDALTGAYIEIALVTDLGTISEAETVVGYTQGETSITTDNDEAEFTFHESEWKVRKTLHGSMDLEFSTALVADYPTLQTLGLVDANGNPSMTADHDVRLYVYNQQPADATTAGVVFEFYNTEVSMDDVSLPTDGSEVNFTGKVNGGWQLGQTPTA